MTYAPSRRSLLTGMAATAASAGLGGCAAISAPIASGDPLAPYRTPYKYDRLLFGGSGVAGSFDEKSVDCPFVFSHDGAFWMTYVGFDGTGYQTGLARSEDLIHWERKGIMLARDPNDPIIKFNIASASILRENDLYSAGKLLKVDGKYVCAWHAYPNSGYEVGAAVIGLAYSTDLLHWERTPPILFAEDGTDWEKGGLYKPCLMKDGDTYYLFYNAKTTGTPWFEQTGVATSKDLKTWTRFAGNPIIRNGDPDTSYDTRFASDPAVYRYKNKWVLYYFGRAKDGRCHELMALGDDLMHFTKTNEPLVSPGPKPSYDDDFTHKPTLIAHKGDLYHFYCAVGGKWPNDIRGITVARSRSWG